MKLYMKRSKKLKDVEKTLYILMMSLFFAILCYLSFIVKTEDGIIGLIFAFGSVLSGFAASPIIEGDFSLIKLFKKY